MGVDGHTSSRMEEGSDYHLVTPRAQREGRIFRPAVLVASALVLTCVIAVVASSGPSRSELVSLAAPAATGVSSEVPLEMMPDPAEAVTVAQETIGQVDPFHRDGSWIVPKEVDDEETPKMIMQPRYAMREGQEAADHASRQPYMVPLQRNNAFVPGVKEAALGQYTPRRQISNNPLAQFIPNITYWPNGDIVPFWEGECEEDDVECNLWKAKGYDNGDVVMPNPREHVDHDPWGLPLAKFGAGDNSKENAMILGMMGIKKEEESQGVPESEAVADAEAILEEVAEASGMSPSVAKQAAETAVEDDKILEGMEEGKESQDDTEAAVESITDEKEEQSSIADLQAKLAEQERIGANSMQKQKELRSAMANLLGVGMPAAPKGGVYAEAMAPQDGLPMVTSVGPAGEIAPAASIVGQPVSTGDVEMISPVFKGPMSQPGYAQTYTQAGAIAGAAAAMQARAAQIQRAKVAGYLLKPMYTTP